MKENPTGWVRYLDNWRFWMGVAYFGLTLTVVWLYVVSARTTREATTRQATESSNATTAYRQCVRSRPELQKLNTHLHGVNDLAATLTLNSAAIVKTTPKTDQQYATRRANLVRIKAASKKIAAVQEFPVPSAADCLKLRPKAS